MEVYIDGQWGTVCDDYWDLQDAAVVCRQLGFLGASSALGAAFFGLGVDPTHLDDVECLGSESSLKNCTFLRTENCNHYEDAGVVCSNIGEYPSVYLGFIFYGFSLGIFGVLHVLMYCKK